MAMGRPTHLCVLLRMLREEGGDGAQLQVGSVAAQEMAGQLAGGQQEVLDDGLEEVLDLSQLATGLGASEELRRANVGLYEVRRNLTRFRRVSRAAWKTHMR
jgi:hypothetical protein